MQDLFSLGLEEGVKTRIVDCLLSSDDANKLELIAIHAGLEDCVQIRSRLAELRKVSFIACS